MTDVCILVIEDNEDDKELIEDLMRTSGVSCHWETVNYAEEGRDLLQDQQMNYDLIFVDVGLPRMSGLDLIKEFVYAVTLSRTPKAAIELYRPPYNLTDCLARIQSCVCHLVNHLRLAKLIFGPLPIISRQNFTLKSDLTDAWR